jgi:predicted lipoprotein with Yx(FWY)xxD motif
MKRKYILTGVLTATVLAGGGLALDAALSGPGARPATGYAAPDMSAAASSGVGTAPLAPGTALVDRDGRTLYLFEADTTATSRCTGACAQVWPPLLNHGEPLAASGAAQAALLGTSPRAGGAQQVTYNGHPLYYFAGDKAPGDVRGKGLNQFGGGWYVVTSTGDKIDPDDAPDPDGVPDASAGPGAAGALPGPAATAPGSPHGHRY